MRLFFALWPDPAAAAALAGLAARIAAKAGGKAVPAEKIHLTLAFLGEVPEGSVEAALAVGGEARVRPFALVFDTLGWFRGARVGWIGCPDPAPGLIDLQSRLAQALHGRGFVLDDRPYSPHITLVRKVARPVARATVEAIGWRARELALVRSEAGTGRYSTIRGWKLGS